ncbi:hypothetical protein Pr1d_22140 [Bythopirellula goksoeyrii]|uniref:Uncharacterized protein n=2 Tax=Bythopirellula goksoeyrii TaxID=1400387 RepID=A0A5B9QDA7_9BACT|nr:hypothetical protein Pr1d_22140 [Bythopirellula goksoeyrii]
MVICAGLTSSRQALGQQPISGRGGEPIAAARRTAIDARPFLRQLDASAVRKWMEISSVCTMAEFELFLGPLAEPERKLLDKMASLTAPIVTRVHFDDLRSILKNGQISSYFEVERLGKHLLHTTPALENELYGAFDCVFASVGPPDGSPRYGDVIIRLRDSVRENGWATPFSGMDFLYAVRHKDARKMQQLLEDGKTLSSKRTDPLSLGFDDRLTFSHYVVTEKHWNRALAYQAILVLRNADDSSAGKQVHERFRKMLATDSHEEFWKLFIPAREKDLPPEQEAARVPFGYLEGKFDNRFLLDDVTAIEVPQGKLEEVLAWPMAREYRALIQSVGE